MAESSNSSGGVTTMGLLGIVFIVLKLTGYISWSWWWVTAPFWVGFVILIPIVILYYWLKRSSKPKVAPVPPPLAKKSKFAQRLEDAMKQAENSDPQIKKVS
jgi:energy-coupling factor transporter transmembrane protein EcfT